FRWPRCTAHELHHDGEPDTTQYRRERDRNGDHRVVDEAFDAVFIERETGAVKCRNGVKTTVPYRCTEVIAVTEIEPDRQYCGRDGLYRHHDNRDARDDAPDVSDTGDLGFGLCGETLTQSESAGHHQ